MNKLLTTITICSLALIPTLSLAEDKKFSGEIDIGGTVSEGRKDSAKSEEYRDLASAPTGDAKIKYNDKQSGDFATLVTENLGRRDMKATLQSGRYGKYKLDVSYDQIPHRFAYGADTIYSGEGSDNLTLPESFKTELSNPKDQAELVTRLQQQVAAQEHSVDLEILRKTWKVMAEYDEYKPIKFKVDISTENREGKRPGMGSFGFGNVVEIIEPISYNTSQARLGGDYTAKGYYVSANYYFSVFQNDVGGLNYSNPFRTGDSTSLDAYSGPRFVNGTYVNNGASKGFVPLAPDNMFHGPSVAASISDLPWRTRVNLAGSLGWMVQDEDFAPYTSNTAIQGVDGVRSFSASDVGSLPVASPDAAVSTALYSIGVSSHPVRWIDTSLKYRYYDYSNNTDEITFPGYVSFDSTWVDEPVTTRPTSYTKQTGSADVGFRLPDNSRLGLLYKHLDTHRENREVANQNENIVGTTIDHRFNELLQLKTSYQKSYRNVGDYDFTKPYGGEDMPGQLPLLRKYYEASREMDSIHFLATLTPRDNLDITGGFLYGNSNYEKSVFGLLDDRNYQFSADVDYDATKWLTLKSSYVYEHHNGSQAARQWAQGAIGDPYFVDTGAFSNSNWLADTEDVIHTVGAGATITLIAKELFFDVNYAFTTAEGTMDFSSPLGSSDDDTNPFIPASFGEVDNSSAHRLTPSLRYKYNKDLTFSLGYLWERYAFDDYQENGFTSVPSSLSGSYNGAILGGAYLLKDYNINMGYLSMKYRF